MSRITCCSVKLRKRSYYSFGFASKLIDPVALKSAQPRVSDTLQEALNKSDRG